MAPVMPFIAERVYKAVGGEKESVHLDSWPTESAIDTDLITDMKLVRELVSLGLMKRTESKINVKQPLLSVTFNRALDEKYFGLIIDELNVKEVKIDETSIVDVILNTTITEELQKEGDMRKLMRAIQDARKEKGLSPSDSVTLIVSSLTLLSDDTQLRATCKISSIKEDVSIVSNPTDFSQHTLYFGIE
jgi:isoleucyl-tRNA synthetase